MQAARTFASAVAIRGGRRIIRKYLVSHPVARNRRTGLSRPARQFATPDPADRWYGHPMKRNAFLCAVLAVACGGSKNDPSREGELGSTTHTSKPGEVHGAAVNDTASNDPHTKFRKS